MDTNTLYTRDGEPVDPARVRRSDTGKPFIVVSVKCCRCGGSGIYTQYHGTCYRCGGHGSTPADTWDAPLYTAEKLARLNATRDKAHAKKDAARIAKLDSARQQFDTERADLLARIPASWLDGTAQRDAEGCTRPDAPRESLVRG